MCLKGKVFNVIKLCSICVLGLLFFLPGTAAYGQIDDEEKSIITIVSAQKSEYKKDSVNGGDMIVLNGNVVISVAKGSSTTVIKAQNVNFNRSTEMLYAEGAVSLETSNGSDGGEEVTADSLLFNTSSMEGIFDNGRVVQASSDALNLPSGSKLIVSSELFGRDSGSTVAFKTGELTFCDDEKPHWRIKASRIWLLPGGEFAFLNAFLYVGRVPLLYLPAFYYPKDELIFNPAFGFKTREGYFINTTLYLYGRKPLDAKSTSELSTDSDSDEDDKIDFFSFMKSTSLKEQRREGIVLHNLEKNYTGDTSTYFKLMADYYSNLGYMTGFDTQLKPGNVLTSLNANLELGFSNTVFVNSLGDYVPYDRTGTKYKDTSNFMSFSSPFRYQANLKFTVAKPFSLTVSMPVYSDPYFDYDFNNRAETMDWIDYFMQNGSTDDNSTDDITEISSFTWSATGSYKIPLPSFVNPYLTSFNLSSFSSSIVYTSKTNTEVTSSSGSEYVKYWSEYTPQRKFYYPSQVTPFKISAKLAGTIYQYPSAAAAKKVAPTKSTVKLTPPESLTETDEKTESEKADKSENKDENKESSQESSIPDEKTDIVFSEKALPLMNVTSPSIVNVNGLTYKLSYTVSPDFTSQFAYSSDIITTPDDFDWNKILSTYYQVKAPTVLTSALGFKDSFVSLTDTFTFNPIYQKHPYLHVKPGKKTTDADYDADEEWGYTETSAASVKKTDYNARKLDLTDVNALTFKPFYHTENFSNTSLTWNTTVKMVRTKFIGDAENPEWQYLTTDIFDDECVTVHNMNLVLAASEKKDKFSQSLSLTSTLPPQVDKYNGVLTFKFPYATFTAATGVKKKSSTDDTWIKEDLTQSLAVSVINDKVKFTESYVYNLEEEYNDSLKLALSGYGAQLAYTASYTTGYDFDNGWKARSEKEFLPYSVSLAYANPSKTFKYWTDKVSFAPSVSSSVVYDCIRPTNSYFKFVPSLTFKINNYLNVTFSSESKNSSIYRYFSKYTDSNINLSGETNPIKDLINSFRFDDVNKRKASGYKIKSLSIAVTHDLDDWDLSSEFTIKPRLLTEDGIKSYDYSPYFTISVSWRPMSSMKTEVVDEYGEWQLNP